MGYIAFEAPTELLSKGTTPGGDHFNFNIGWSPVSGANYYVLERESNIGTWNVVNCAKAPVEINAKQLIGCNVDLTSADEVPELGRMIYRVAACNSSGVCGNYIRHNFALAEANDGANLLTGGSFEEDNFMLVRSASELSFETESPITGNRSLKIVTNGYELVYYSFNDFGEQSRHLNKVTFSGTINITRTVFVNLRVFYVGGSWSTKESNVKYIRYNFNANQGFSIDVDLEPSKEVESIYISLNSGCGSCVEPMKVIIDDLKLTVETPKILSIKTNLLGSPVVGNTANGIE